MTTGTLPSGENILDTWNMAFTGLPAKNGLEAIHRLRFGYTAVTHGYLLRNEYPSV